MICKVGFKHHCFTFFLFQKAMLQVCFESVWTGQESCQNWFQQFQRSEALCLVYKAVIVTLWLIFYMLQLVSYKDLSFSYEISWDLSERKWESTLCSALVAPMSGESKQLSSYFTTVETINPLATFFFRAKWNGTTVWICGAMQLCPVFV